MTTKYYHKNSNVVAFERIERGNGYWFEKTYDERGNLLTYKNSNGLWFERTYDERDNELTFKNSDGFWVERTYDERGKELIYKNSNGYFGIKGKDVTEGEFNKFITNKNRPCIGKKVVIDGIEYEFK